MLHVADCVAQGYGKITIRTVDTDVVVLAVSIVAKLDISELWVAFGTGKTFRYIGAHTIASNLGQYKSAALPLFHSLSGCDTVSSFAGRGKKTCWDVWRIFEPLTETLMNLAEAPSQLQLAELQTLQQFTVLLYSRTCGLLTVNEAGNTCLHRVQGPWKTSLQRRHHCWNTVSEPHIRVGTYGVKH